MTASKMPKALGLPDKRFSIRPVCIDDVSILQSCLWHERTIEDIEGFIQRILTFRDNRRGIGIVVLDGNNASLPIVAYGQMMQWLQCVEISDLLVHSQYRDQGIGTAMIQFLIQFVLSQHKECVELGVAESNPRALALYRRLGFCDSYTLHLDLGQGNEPVIYLRLDLTPYL